LLPRARGSSAELKNKTSFDLHSTQFGKIGTRDPSRS
jgi:hypothetical protein